MSLRRLLAATALSLALAPPAKADPITGALAAVGSFFAGSAVASSLLHLGVGLALSAWQRAKQTRAERRGIRIDQVLTGDTNSETFVIGRSATAGMAVGPYRSHGKDNRWLTMVIDLGGVPGMALEAVFVNNEPCPLRYDRPRADYGIPVEQEVDKVSVRDGEDGDFLLYVKFYDGSQTAADRHLLDEYGDDPDYPWTADMVGRGRCYAIVTAKFHQTRQTAIPQLRFGLRGIPLYDPRRDSTAGGAGPQRAGDPATWAFSENVSVQSYNLLRGIPVGPDVYGGRVRASQLPQGTMFAAMNEADRLIEESSGAVPQYRAGLEVEVDRSPAEVAEDILRTSAGTVAETGGVWTMRVGPAAAPLHVITDGDIPVDRPTQLDPFPGLADTINGIVVTHPDPELAWEMREAPPIVRADLEAADDGRRLREALDLSACPYGVQAQRVARLYLEDGRRFVRHHLPLPPDARHLRVLDVLLWQSERNQYAGKLFEVTERSIDLSTYMPELTIREINAADGIWTSDLELPVARPAPSRTAPEIEAPEFELTGIALPDGDGVDRRAALLVESDDPDVPHDVEVVYASTELQVAFLPAVVPGTGLVVKADILPAQTYKARVRYAAGGLRPAWSPWATARTPDIRLGELDLADVIRARFEAADAALAEVDALTAQVRGDIEALQRESSDLRAEAAALRKKAASIPLIAFVKAQVAGAAVRIEAATRSDETGALAVRIDKVETTFTAAVEGVATETAAVIEEERFARSDADAALAFVVGSVTARMTAAEGALAANSAAITTQQSALASANGAIAVLRQDVTARMTAAEGAIAANNAAITTQQSAQASANGAIAVLQQNVSAQAFGLSALSSTVQTVSAKTDGTAATLQASYIIKVLSGTGGAQLALYSYSSGGVTRSFIKADADDFLVDGTVTAAKMAANSITATNGAIANLAVERIKIKDGAITDKFLDRRAGGIAMTAPFSGVIEPFSYVDVWTGSRASDDISTEYWYGEFRAPPNGGLVTINFEYRTKRDGSWSNWVPSLSTGTSLTSWTPFAHSIGVPGPLEGVELRMKIGAQAGSTSVNNYTFARDLVCGSFRVTK